MKNAIRLKDYKLGRIHGKVKVADDRSEAQIQRVLFSSQKLKLWKRRGEDMEIRIFGYEIPLTKGTQRGECVDLMGYDSDSNLYLIELKKEDSLEKINNIEKQIDSYEIIVKQILPNLAVEFEKEFFLPIQFKKIRKTILAPIGFFKNKELLRHDIDYCYFRDRKIHKHNPGEAVSVHLKKK